MNHLLYLHARAARQAALTLLRQPLGSLLSLLMLALALSLPLGLYLTVQSLANWGSRLATTPQITLFMEAAADSTDLQATAQTLKQHALVAHSQFVPRDEALKALMARNKLEGLTEGLGENPLPDAFVITPKDMPPEALERLHKELSGLTMVESAQFDAGWAKKLFSLIQLGQQLTVVLACVFGGALVLITFNTIRLQVLARRDEIEVSKLIGATNSFIRRPFMYYALYQGALAALLAWAGSMWLIATANPAIAELARLYNEGAALRPLSLGEGGLLLLAAGVLTTLGARLATGQLLRQMEAD